MLVVSLQKLGFTSYEAKVFVALVKNESATVSTLHLDSGVPNSAIYAVLKKLEKKGIIEFQNTKPMRYRCVSPEDAIAKLKRDYAEECDIVLDQLQELCNVPSIEKNEELMWTINGVRNVVDKVIQMLEGAQTDILMLSSSIPLCELVEKYGIPKKDYSTIIGIFNRKTSNENVTLRLISFCEEDAKMINTTVPLATVKINYMEDCPLDQKGFVLVVDNSEMLMDIVKEDDGETDLTAVWTNGKEFASTISYLLNAKWETSEDYSSL